MRWFKNNIEQKTEQTEVCGFLDVHGTFFHNKEDRDKSNKEINYRFQVDELSGKFDNIINKYEFSSRISITSFDKIQKEDKLKILDLASRYLKLKQEYYS